MFISKCKVNFVDKVVGVTKDGEKYISVNVIPIDDNKKYNFISKDDNVINLFNTYDFKRFEEITISLAFIREFRPETRTSYWAVVLTGVE